ncbi:MAG: hypothetical protein GC149_14220 [Gammaproteobacteria bacterium]|nr:hypothetical protein [Gammaproteobacteria bacterium]
MQTTWKIQNISKRPITLIRDTGQALHLNPGCVSELTSQEVEHNAMVTKLIREKLIKRVTVEGTGKKASDEEQKSESHTTGRSAGKTAKKH